MEREPIVKDRTRSIVARGQGFMAAPVAVLTLRPALRDMECVWEQSIWERGLIVTGMEREKINVPIPFLVDNIRIAKVLLQMLAKVLFLTLVPIVGLLQRGRVME